MLSFTEMVKAQFWLVSPSLEQIQAVINEVGAKKSVQAILDNQRDVPGYPRTDTLFPYGFGMTY